MSSPKKKENASKRTNNGGIKEELDQAGIIMFNEQITKKF